MRFREDSAGLLWWPSSSMRVSARWSVGMARRYCSLVCRRRIPLRHPPGSHRSTLLSGGSTPYPHSVRVGQGEGQTLLGDGAHGTHCAGPSHDGGVGTTGQDEGSGIGATAGCVCVPLRAASQLSEPRERVGLFARYKPGQDRRCGIGHVANGTAIGLRWGRPLSNASQLRTRSPHVP